MNVFTITFKQQLLMLLQPISYYLIVGMGMIYSIDIFSGMALLVGVVFIAVTDTLPAIILHTQYLFRNKDAIFTVDEQELTLSYLSKKEKINAHFSEIKNLIFYVAISRKTGIYSFARYRYFKVILNNDSEIIITCLMINDIENKLESILYRRYEKELVFYCLIGK